MWKYPSVPWAVDPKANGATRATTRRRGPSLKTIHIIILYFLLAFFLGISVFGAYKVDYRVGVAEGQDHSIEYWKNETRNCVEGNQASD
jgi:hypothetical protein